MSKSSIIIYLESSPPFLLELIYSCVFSIILIVFIFTVRERTHSFTLAFNAATKQQHLQTSAFNNNNTTKTIKRLSNNGDGEVIYSNDKKLNPPPLKVHYRSRASDDSSCTTSETNGWSQNFKGSIEELAIFCPPAKIIESGTQKQRGRSHNPTRRMDNNSSTTIPSYHQFEQEEPEKIDDMTPEEYESYVQSMTSIWNKLFNKSKSLPQSKNVSPPTEDDSSSINSEQTDIGAKEWKRRIQKIWTRNDILKTDSTLAVCGSESELNIHVFTESELKMVEQPFKESTDSIYSNYPESNNLQDSDLCTMSGDECKKSQFDVIYEEQ